MSAAHRMSPGCVTQASAVEQPVEKSCGDAQHTAPGPQDWGPRHPIAAPAQSSFAPMHIADWVWGEMQHF